MSIGITQSFQIGEGVEITLETGKLARQADGAVVVKQGKTMLLATVVSGKDAREGIDFLPLTVEYREKFASTGKFPGGFIKREARPSDAEILVSRLIDRALRPLFPSDYHGDTQVFVSLISSDKETMPDALACLGAAAAIAVSDIPFAGPISEARVARIDGKFMVNPTKTQLETADIEMMVGATASDILMVEGEMKEVSEAEMIEAIRIAHEAIKIECAAINALAAEVASSAEKREYSHEEEDDDALFEQIKAFAYDRCYAIAKDGHADKHLRKEKFGAIRDEFKESLDEDTLAEKKDLISKYYNKVQKEAIRQSVLTERTRLDGRQLNEVRPIWSEVDYLPGTHGSALFTRGETQSLTSLTLGSKMDEQSIDGAFREGKERFMLHYNFPPFSTGEARPIRGLSRREVGHGNLAYRALKNMIPADNPYTIRVVSDILESNGSSSMATVCAGSLALMDGGINIAKPVSGIAMGMISDTSGNYAILSDILGDEDHLGDMDFKVTGTVDGITACQMDIKVDGLSFEVLAEALDQAREGRLHILGEMNKTLSEPKGDYKEHAPRIVQLTIPKDTIGAVIGPGGKIIQEIQAETETTIVISEEGDLGIVDILSENKASIDAAVERIRMIAAVPEVGEVYKGRVRNITAFGAFIEILPGRDGLLHISEIDHKRINNVEDVMKVGDEMEVKLIEIDQKSGKLRLSRKVLLPKPEAN